MDTLRVKILKDGTARSEVDQISGANHNNAEQLFDFLKEKLGGGETVTSRGHQEHGHRHEHADDHVHTGGKK